MCKTKNKFLKYLIYGSKLNRNSQLHDFLMLQSLKDIRILGDVSKAKHTKQMHVVDKRWSVLTVGHPFKAAICLHWWFKLLQNYIVQCIIVHKARFQLDWCWYCVSRACIYARLVKWCYTHSRPFIFIAVARLSIDHYVTICMNSSPPHPFLCDISGNLYIRRFPKFPIFSPLGQD